MIYWSISLGQYVGAGISIPYEYIIPDSLSDKLYDLFHTPKRGVLTLFQRSLVKKNPRLVNKLTTSWI